MPFSYLLQTNLNTHSYHVQLSVNENCPLLCNKCYHSYYTQIIVMPEKKFQDETQYMFLIKVNNCHKFFNILPGILQTQMNSISKLYILRMLYSFNSENGWLSQTTCKFFCYSKCSVYILPLLLPKTLATYHQNLQDYCKPNPFSKPSLLLPQPGPAFQSLQGQIRTTKKLSCCQGMLPTTRIYEVLL